MVLCLLDTIDFPTVFFGAMRAGAVPVPVSTLLTTADYEFLVADSRARVLVVSAALYPKFAPLLAQVINPADAARSSSAAPDSQGAGAEGGRRRSWELPEIVVMGEPAHRLREEQRVGAYRQPRWTATRRFPTTLDAALGTSCEGLDLLTRFTTTEDGEGVAAVGAVIPILGLESDFYQVMLAPDRKSVV